MKYRIEIGGTLDPSWTDWLGPIQIESRQGTDGSLVTSLTTGEIDQSTLFGILDRLRDLNLVLVAVNADNKPIKL